MTVTWPTVLTLGRLLAAPAIGVVFLVFARPVADWLALGIFVFASLTDWLDGVLARRWGQISRLGTMLDPIADKAMVVLSLTALVGLFGMIGWVVIPALVIMFREIFVSGLREYLGSTAGTLAVTSWAKLKTGVQMVGIAVLLAHGIVAHHLGMLYFSLGDAMATDILTGAVDDEVGLRTLDGLARYSLFIGIGLLWAAAFLTAVTGWDYFAKAKQHLGGRTQS